MMLSMSEAARLLGQTQRQVRYQVKRGQVKATKVGGRWMIDEADLPATASRKEQGAAHAAALKQAVDKALAPHVAVRARYTVESVAAFREGVLAWRAAREALGDHPAVAALAAANLAMSRGAHGFRTRAKALAFEEARGHASDAVAWLFMEGSEKARAVASSVEVGVLPALSGLIRRQEKGEQP